MADSKSNSKLSKKSKSISNTHHNKTSSKQAAPSKCVVCPICIAAKSKTGPSNDMFCKSGSGSCRMLLEKLDLQYFKETTLKKMKTSLNSSFPATRDACIEHALDMVINNLIQNGHLEPAKAQHMRNQLMKSQIAAICDDMVSATAKIAKASTSKIRYRSGSFTNSKPVIHNNNNNKSKGSRESRQSSRERQRRSNERLKKRSSDRLQRSIERLHRSMERPRRSLERTHRSMERPHERSVERFQRSTDRFQRSTERLQKSTEMLQRSKEKLSRSTERSKERLPRKEKSQTQKWAIQPVALPITIVTDQNLPKLPNFTMMEKINLSMKETGSLVKDFKNISVEDVKKQKPAAAPKTKAKSLDSSSEKKHSSKPDQIQKQKPERIYEKRNSSNSPHQATSEVPSSNHSLENNANLLTEHNVNKSKAKKSKSEKLVVQTEEPKKEPKEPKEPPLPRVEDSNKNIIEAKQDKTINSQKPGDVKKETSLLVEKSPTPLPTTPEAPHRVPVVSSSEIKDAPVVVAPPSKTVTISSLIGSNTTIASSMSGSGYHVLVDMRGFQNNEISMEVAGRQLYFLASRSKRNDLNARKVTETVDVPDRAKMENLKIGRRTDGYVLIEECEQDIAQKT